MADETQGASPTPTESPTATTEPAEAAPVAEADGQVEAAAPEQTAEFDWSRLETVDLDELIQKAPKLKDRLEGKAGALAQKQAEKLARERFEGWQREQHTRLQAEAHQREQDELRRLATEDPDKLAERVLTQDEQRRKQAEDRQREQATFDRFQREVGGHLEAQLQDIYSEPEFKELWESSDPETRRALDWKSHPSFAKFTAALARAYADHHASERAETLAKSRFDAHLLDEQARRMKAEGKDRPDLALQAAVPGGKLYTREDLARMMSSREGRAEWKANKHIIDQQIAQGLIAAE